ncbi:hypothetical protein AYO38_06265 [bacterium SCGC AG-212-C10]|nr:hypothetical protein AYO38_06265 [bacterium SCGC AG-212-C10]
MSATDVPRAVNTGIQGDVDCSGSVTVVDVLRVLQFVAGVGQSAECMATAGDVNCDGRIDLLDAQRILRFVAGIADSSPLGCVAIGQPLGAPVPAAFEGSAKSTYTSQNGNIVGIATTSNVRFAIDEESQNNPGSDYWTVSGLVNWTYEGTNGDCTVSGSGSFSVANKEGHLFVADPDAQGKQQYYGAGGRPPADPFPKATMTCPGSQPFEVNINGAALNWFFASISPDHVVAEDGHVRGTEEQIGGAGSKQTWEWDFAPVP